MIKESKSTTTSGSLLELPVKKKIKSNNLCFDERELARIREDMSYFLSEYTDMRNILNKLIADSEKHSMNIVNYLCDRQTTLIVLEILKSCCDGTNIGDCLKTENENEKKNFRCLKAFIASNKKDVSLLIDNTYDINFKNEMSKKDVFVDANKDVGARGFPKGDEPTKEEKVEIVNYHKNLLDVQAIVISDLKRLLSKITTNLPNPYNFMTQLNSRVKSPDGIIDKINRMRNAGRVKYVVGDVIDAIGCRMTVVDTIQLNSLYNEVINFYNDNVLEVENMYAKPKKNYGYRVITLIISVKYNNEFYTFELQISTLRASIVADIEHNTLFKPIIEINQNEKNLVNTAYQEAACLEQLEIISPRKIAKYDKNKIENFKTLNLNQVYQAEKDGEIHIYEKDSTNTYVTVYVGKTTPPKTPVLHTKPGSGDEVLLCEVTAGDYFQVRGSVFKKDKILIFWNEK